MAEKEAAQFTYKGEPGYMPMIGHLAEAGVVIHDEFLLRQRRPGHTESRIRQSPRARLPCGHAIAHVRLDSAGIPSTLLGTGFNYLDSTGKTSAIGGRLDAPTQQADAAHLPLPNPPPCGRGDKREKHKTMMPTSRDRPGNITPTARWPRRRTA